MPDFVCFMFDCVGEVNVELVCLLLANPRIVFQRVCCDPSVSRCSLHMSLVCTCMSDVISEFCQSYCVPI